MEIKNCNWRRMWALFFSTFEVWFNKKLLVFCDLKDVLKLWRWNILILMNLMLKLLLKIKTDFFKIFLEHDQQPTDGILWSEIPQFSTMVSFKHNVLWKNVNVLILNLRLFSRSNKIAFYPTTPPNYKKKNLFTILPDGVYFTIPEQKTEWIFSSFYALICNR